jgi:hypothetical protein
LQVHADVNTGRTVSQAARSSSRRPGAGFHRGARLAAAAQDWLRALIARFALRARLKSTDTLASVTCAVLEGAAAMSSVQHPAPGGDVLVRQRTRGLLTALIAAHKP